MYLEQLYHKHLKGLPVVILGGYLRRPHDRPLCVLMGSLFKNTFARSPLFITSV